MYPQTCAVVVVPKTFGVTLKRAMEDAVVLPYAKVTVSEGHNFLLVILVIILR